MNLAAATAVGDVPLTLQGTLSPVEQLALEDEAVQRAVVRRLTGPQKRDLLTRWSAWAHPGQLPPPGDWRVWLLMAGRGFGKTRGGAEWVSALARADPSLRIALVGRTNDEVRKVMVEGESGLFAVARPGERFHWASTAGVLRFHSGALGFVYSSRNPEKLRGPQHHVAWCDELAKWADPDVTWDNLMLGLRLGETQRTLVTTTPRPIPLVRRIEGDPGTATTRGGTADNCHLSADYVETMQRLYGGTRLGRQELEGELIDDIEGALWTRAMIEKARAPRPEALRRVVIGVDPPLSASEDADACGIVAVGLGADGLGYVLGDRSVQGLSPEGWARAVGRAAEEFGADRVVAEANNGGAMVESVLRGARQSLPIRLVHATRGKAPRAEPVAALFESGQAKFAGRFPLLEDELAGLGIAGRYEGPGRSPDRADAMVWAMTELLLGKPKAAPRITFF
ncbi:MAG TPA: terminase family protein [Allosphingosinicella sp.]|nr:terminase family protein [Allosphingosinicella sp.]